MKLTRTIEHDQMGSGHGLRRRLLLAVAAMVTVQAATTAFSQEEMPPSPSTQQSTAPVDDMKLRVLQIPQGAFVEVRLIRARLLQGQLGDVVDEGFMLRTISHNRLVNRQVGFEELQSVRPLDNPKTRD